MGKPDARRRVGQRRSRRSGCPVACTLDLIGDKWTLLVIRDLLLGKTRYMEFQNSEEKIPTNILADRLQRLENANLIYRTRYRERPPRFEYHLTETGRSLKPVIGAIIQWANKYIPETDRPPRRFD